MRICEHSQKPISFPNFNLENSQTKASVAISVTQGLLHMLLSDLPSNIMVNWPHLCFLYSKWAILIIASHLYTMPVAITNEESGCCHYKQDIVWPKLAIWWKCLSVHLFAAMWKLWKYKYMLKGWGNNKLIPYNYNRNPHSNTDFM